MRDRINVDPLRKIVDRERYQTGGNAPGTWSVRLTLECGHTKRCGFSDAPLYKARCRECAK